MRLAWGIGVAVICFAMPFPMRAQDVQGLLWPSALAANDRAERWSARGEALYREGSYRESIASFERALQLGTLRPGLAAWNIVRGYARIGNWKQVLRWLSHAVDLGYDDWQAMRDEPALEPFRNDPRYIELMNPRSARGRGHYLVRR